MHTFLSIPQCRQYVAAQRQAGRTLGFVPTMGALHEAHLSLMRRSVEENDTTLISIFVNPTHFGPGEDYQQYPRDLARDSALAAGVGVDAIFAPSPATMYPPGAGTYIDQGGATVATLEGAHRPGHFRGVLTIVAKLLNIVQPHVAYFGRKDYQQAVVVQRMVRDLDLPVAIALCPTVREPDGLAMSSRNRCLSPAERTQARAIHRALDAAQALLATGETCASALADTIRSTIVDAGPCSVDYVAIAHPDTLAPLDTVRSEAIALVAVRIGSTRLIDNARLAPKD